MYQRIVRNCFARHLHRRTPLPELDFTKPISDRLRKTSFKDHSDNSSNQSFLKVPLRGQCLFGLYPIELALKAKRRQFYQLFLSNTSQENRPLVESIQRLADQLSVPIKYADTNTLDRLSFDRPHQGVCLDCSPLPLEEVEQTTMKTDSKQIFLDLCLVKTHDPMNLGAVLRTAHFFGVDRIILTRGTCQPSPVASKASSGALELMSIYTCHDLPAYLKVLNEQQNVVLVCGTHKGTIPLRVLRIQDMKNNRAESKVQRIVIIIGNEHDGIPEEVSSLCNYNVCIQPHMNSEISSLNASVACALFLYHISAQIHA